MDLGLSGKVAVVTGSSRGIGRGIATRLAAEGARVVVAARGAEGVAAVVAEIERTGGEATGAAVDVTTAEGAEGVVAAALERFGGIDVVVNNVGGSGARTVDAMDVDDLNAVLGRNLIPALAVSRAALPALREGGGVIAMIASIWGREAGGSPGYNVAKAAEISLAAAMARDLAGDGIRVFSVAPGSTLFPGGSWERRVSEDPEGMAAYVERELPWGRFGTVEEIADVVTFLVSARASWVVGTCVVVDGGQSRSF